VSLAPKVTEIPTSLARANTQVNAAQEALYANNSDLPQWPWLDVQRLCGSPLPGDLTVIGARPANGKTSMMLNLFDHFTALGYPTLYIGAGSEGPPKDLRRQWAALRLGYPSHLVMENRWSELPSGPSRFEPGKEVDARSRVFYDLQEQSMNEHAVAHFADAGEKLTPEVLTAALRDFRGCTHGRYVLLDHIHRIRFGTEKNPRLELAEATRWLRDMAAKYEWSIIVAAQLHRAPGQNGALRDLIPPTTSDLKETGTLEEDAVVVLLLHRVKRSDADAAQVNAVARGERPVSDILEPRCMAVRIGKHRRRGHVMDSTAFLNIGDDGRLTSRAPVWRKEDTSTEARYGV
jgi:replicative DNA helicase